jgi:hypothetical protein
VYSNPTGGDIYGSSSAARGRSLQRSREPTVLITLAFTRARPYAASHTTFDNNELKL